MNCQFDLNCHECEMTNPELPWWFIKLIHAKYNLLKLALETEP